VLRDLVDPRVDLRRLLGRSLSFWTPATVAATACCTWFVASLDEREIS
jgi:hypothetical protein